MEGTWEVEQLPVGYEIGLRLGMWMTSQHSNPNPPIPPLTQLAIRITWLTWTKKKENQTMTSEADQMA
jgi:hypothetical protein